MKQTNASSKGRSYRQKQNPGEKDKAITPVEAAPKTIPIEEAWQESSNHKNASSKGRIYQKSSSQEKRTKLSLSISSSEDDTDRRINAHNLEAQKQL